MDIHVDIYHYVYVYRWYIGFLCIVCSLFVLDIRHCLEKGPGLPEYRDGCHESTDDLGINVLLCICSDKDNCNAGHSVTKPAVTIIVCSILYGLRNMLPYI